MSETATAEPERFIIEHREALAPCADFTLAVTDSGAKARTLVVTLLGGAPGKLHLRFDAMARVLVGIDLSAQTQAVIERAAWFAERLQAEVWLLHVAPPEPDFVGYQVGPQAVRTQAAQALRQEHRQTQQYAERLRQAGKTVTPLVVQGPTVACILEHADRLDVDLIVIGSRGHNALYEVLVGSVAHDLLKRTARPVLVVPPAGG